MSVEAKGVILIGSGGHASSTLDVLAFSNSNVIGYTSQEKSNSRNFASVPYLGTDESLSNFSKMDVCLVMGIGFGPNKLIRKSLTQRLKDAGWSFLPIVSSLSHVSQSALLESGVAIHSGAFIGPNASIAADAVINTGATVEHGTSIGSNTHVGPGAVICGEATIGSDVEIGANATILPGIKITDSCVIGAGSVIIQNVNESSTLVGVPGRIIV